MPGTGSVCKVFVYLTTRGDGPSIFVEIKILYTINNTPNLHFHQIISKSSIFHQSQLFYALLTPLLINFYRSLCILSFTFILRIRHQNLELKLLNLCILFSFNDCFFRGKTFCWTNVTRFLLSLYCLNCISFLSGFNFLLFIWFLILLLLVYRLFCLNIDDRLCFCLIWNRNFMVILVWINRNIQLAGTLFFSLFFWFVCFFLFMSIFIFVVMLFGTLFYFGWLFWVGMILFYFGCIFCIFCGFLAFFIWFPFAFALVLSLISWLLRWIAGCRILGGFKFDFSIIWRGWSVGMSFVFLRICIGWQWVSFYWLIFWCLFGRGVWLSVAIFF